MISPFVYVRFGCSVGNLCSEPHSSLSPKSLFRSFKEFIDDKHEVYMYDRFWNWEIMAGIKNSQPLKCLFQGSYIVKGTKFGKAFVRGFANFEFIHPKINDHGTDNGAIQVH